MFAFVATFGLGALICWLTLTPQSLPKSSDYQLDKVAHFIAFAALILPTAVLRPAFLWWCLPLAAGLGIGIEVIQPYFDRSKEWMDTVADLFGLAAGTGVGLILRQTLKHHRLLPD